MSAISGICHGGPLDGRLLNHDGMRFYVQVPVPDDMLARVMAAPPLDEACPKLDITVGCYVYVPYPVCRWRWEE